MVTVYSGVPEVSLTVAVGTLSVTISVFAEAGVTNSVLTVIVSVTGNVTVVVPEVRIVTVVSVVSEVNVKE